MEKEIKKNKNEIHEKLSRRRNMVQIVYRFFLVNENVSKIKQEILDDSQLEGMKEEWKPIFEDLIDYIPNAAALISNYLVASWKWNRIPKMIQAIMCVAIYEIKFLEGEPAIIINSSLELTREYLPSWDVKFVNAVLDKVTKGNMKDE
jgi:N utilization substance protein B